MSYDKCLLYSSKKNIFVENIFNLIVHQHQNENVPAKQITDFFWKVEYLSKLWHERYVVYFKNNIALQKLFKEQTLPKALCRIMIFQAKLYSTKSRQNQFFTQLSLLP